MSLRLLPGPHGGAAVTNSPPTPEIRVQILPRPKVGKLVVVIGQQLTVQKLEQLYILV